MPLERSLPALALLSTLLAAATPLGARELSWPRIEVEARLAADGRLTFAETDWMLFDGDWNGGQRDFRLLPGQKLSLDRMVRIDAGDGSEHPMRRGDLGAVDHWQWVSPTRLRWRARRPEDPPFRQATRIYRLEGSYTGILVDLGGGRYRLDHDFAFSEREGAIERFVVRLTLDPAWRCERGQELEFSGGPLPPGAGFVVTADLVHVGAGEAELASPRHLADLWIFGGLAALWGYAAWRGLRFVRRDRALGRFEPLPPSAKIDRAWLEEKVFADPPEVVGAAWDRRVGAAEVAAMLARLVQEKKIDSAIERRKHWLGSSEVLTMRLLVPRSFFSAEERPLVDGLFPLGETIDSEALRKHYRNSGFDPASKIRSGLEKAVKHLRGFGNSVPVGGTRVTASMILGAILLLVLAFAFSRQAALLGIAGGVVAVSLPFLILAAVARSWVRRLAIPLGGILAALTLASGVILPAATAPDFPLAGLAGALLLAAGLARSMFNLLSTRESREALARRREMTAARDYFEAQLGRPRPELEDRWFPWLIAFGLAPKVDRWCRSFAAAGSATALPTGGFSGSGGGIASSGWSGGGGAFGGAGATASFASAISSMAAGVSSSSSSSGGGGGGGGGGSSGGGGGGGW